MPNSNGEDAQVAAKTEYDYEKLGFKCGLEIHQRLATAEKLFCSCPATESGEPEKPASTITRYQRAVAGELGDIDRSAEFEESRSREFLYEVRPSRACLVEIDEEPPHRLNGEALRSALAIALSTGMRIVAEMQPMRKEVVDGSDPAAFQRTMLVGMDGKISVGGREIGIPSMFLEEESSGIVSATEDSITYDTDRIGIPLVEIDTDPYIPDPRTAKAVALYLGALLRVSGFVQRGIGSIRQDVNVSIKGGARCEIKGLQEVEGLDAFVENEVGRQVKLLEIKDRLVKAAASVEPPADVTDVLRGTTAKIVSGQLRRGGIVIGFCLRGFAGVLGTEINPKRRLGSEISDYAKMGGVNGIIHSDEDLAAYGFSEGEVAGLRRKLGLGERDAFVIIAGKPESARRAAKLAFARAAQALAGIPPETRGIANNELRTTRFARPLPTGSRMYPETDSRPVLLTKESEDWAGKNAPSLEDERKRLNSIISNRAVAEQLLLHPKSGLFKYIVGATKADPDFVANTLIQKFTELRRNGVDVDSIRPERLAELFDAYAKGSITKQAVDELLKRLSRGDAPVDRAIGELSLRRITGTKLKALIEEVRDANRSDGAELLRKKVMARHRLTVDGAELNEMLGSG